MKQLYVLLVLWLTIGSAVGQNKVFGGHWYAGSEVGIFSNKTRMIVGELSKYSAGGSGVMPLYGFKIGRMLNPYLAVETGIYAQPLNMVYQYQYDYQRVTGAAPFHFIMFPVRLNYRLQVLSEQLEAQIGVGLQYVDTRNQLARESFSGSIVTPRHTSKDSLFYVGNVDIVRSSMINAEVSLGINWALSHRWTVSVFGRQAMGLANITRVEVDIRQNQEPVEKAEFTSRGSGFNLGLGIRYNLRK